MKIRVTILLLCLCSTIGMASVTTYTSLSTFTTATGATLRPINPITDTTATTTDGSITVAPLQNNIIFDTATYGNPIPGGDDWVISGEESQDFIINVPSAYSFGFEIYNPSTVPLPNGCNATCFDDTFTMTLFNGATNLGSFSFVPGDDQVLFYGIASSTSFDRVELRETPPNIDDEFFANLYLGTQSVPEPATLTLLVIGLSGIYLRRR